MTMITAYEKLVHDLRKLYDPGEAKSIARIVMEDGFHFYHFQEDRPVEKEESSKLKAIKSRLLAGEPIQYILGEADFYSIKLKVNPKVLIPRQETEELVHWIIQVLKKNPERQTFKVLDIGTGSGCIGISLKKVFPALEVLGLDVSEEAIQMAIENAKYNETEVQFMVLDFLDEKKWDELPKFDIIISNPPYIPEKERAIMDQHVIDHEPGIALFVEDATILYYFIKKISRFGLKHLQKNGFLYFESNAFNADEVLEFMKISGYEGLRKTQRFEWKRQNDCGSFTSE